MHMGVERGGGRQLGLLEVTAMAVGTMIGASIFSIFGVGAALAGSNLPEAFLVSALPAFLVGYSYARLGACFVSNAGPIAFIARGFGDGLFTGTLSVLLWLSYVVSIALFAKGFAGYLLPLLGIAAGPWSSALAEALLIAVFTALNVAGGAAAVGRAEFWIVLVKLAILALFVALGAGSVRATLVRPHGDAHHVAGMCYAGAIFVLSYMGFGLVTNASEDMRAPRRNVPRAIYLSLGFVMLVYVAVSAVAVGNLAPARLVAARDFALAEAARPFLGHAGYLLVSLGALFSIGSALNATLYGGANIAYALARDGELPERFERKAWFGSTVGLYLTAALGMVMAAGFDLAGIAAFTSVVYLVIYLAVVGAHLRLRAEVGGRAWLLRASLAVLVLTTAVVLVHQWQQGGVALVAMLVVFPLALVAEAWLRRYRGKRVAIPTRAVSCEDAQQHLQGSPHGTLEQQG